MSPLKKSTYYIISLLLAHQCFAAIGVDLQGYFSQGNCAYSKGDWIAARDAYEKALQRGQSCALRYNLGNVCFQQGCYGEAIWNYECALALNPSDSRIQANLKRTRDKLNLKEPKNSIIKKIAYSLSVNTWEWTACLSFWLSIGFLVFPRMYGKNSFITYLISSLCICIFIGACLSLLIHYHSRNLAIALHSDTPIYKAAAPSSGVVGYIREGESVHLQKHTHQDYIRLTAPNGVTGWASTSSLGIVWN